MTLRISVRLERWPRRFAQQDSIALTLQPKWRAMLGIIVRQAHFRKPNVRWGRTAAIPRRRWRVGRGIIVRRGRLRRSCVRWGLFVPLRQVQ